MTTERLAVELELDTRQFNRQLSRTRTSLRNFARSATRSIGVTARGLRTAATAAGALAAGVTAAGAGLAAFSSNYVNDLRRAQALTGQTVQEIEQLTTLLRAAGAENPLEDSIELIREFANRLGEAAQDGTGAAFMAFETLGFSVEDLQSRFAQDSVGTVEFVLARINQLGDRARETFNLEEIFGGQGSQVAQLVNNLSAYERSLIAIQATNRNLISPEQQQAIQQQTLQFGFLRDNVRDLALQFGSALAPGISQALTQANRFIQSIDIDSVVTPFRRGVDLVFSLIGTVARRTLPLFGRSFSFVLNRLEAFGDFFGDNRNTITRFFSRALSAAEGFRNRFITAIDFSGLQQTAGEGSSGIAGFFERTFNSIRNVIRNIIDSDLFQQFLDSTQGIRDLISKEFGATLEVITERLLPALITFAEGFNKFIAQVFGTAEEVSPLLRTFGLLIEVVIAFAGAFIRGILEILAILFEFSGGLLRVISFIGNLPIIRQLFEFFNGILEFLRDLPDVIQSLIVDIILAFIFPPSLAATGGRIAATFGRFITQLGRRIAGFLPTTIQFIALRIPRFIASIGRLLTGAFNSLPGVFQMILGNLGRRLTAIFNQSILSLFSRLGTAIPNQIDVLFSSISDNLARLAEDLILILAKVIDNIIEALPDILKGIPRAIFDFLIDLADAFTRGLGPGFGFLFKTLDNIISGFLRFFDAFSSTIGNSIQAAREQLDDIKEFFSDLRDSIPGLDFLEGLSLPSVDFSFGGARNQTTPSTPPGAMLRGADNQMLTINGSFIEVQGNLSTEGARELRRGLEDIERNGNFISGLLNNRRLTTSRSTT